VVGWAKEKKFHQKAPVNRQPLENRLRIPGRDLQLRSRNQLRKQESELNSEKMLDTGSITNPVQLDRISTSNKIFRENFENSERGTALLFPRKKMILISSDEHFD
jgi:hypothetical protein